MPAQPGPAILAAAEQHNIGAQSKLNATNNPQDINNYRSPKRGNKITILASDASIRLCIPADHDLMPLSENGSVPCIDNMQLSSSQKEWLQGYAKDGALMQPTSGSQQQIHHDEAVIQQQQQQQQHIMNRNNYVVQHDLINLPPISRLEQGSLATNHKDLMKLHQCAQTGTNLIDPQAVCDQDRKVHDKLGNYPVLGAESSCDETSYKPTCSSMKQDGQSSVPNHEDEEKEGDEEKSSAAANINPVLKVSDEHDHELFHMKGTINTSSNIDAFHASPINEENQHIDTSIESSMISDVEHLDPLLEELKQLYMIRPSLKNDHNPADVLSSKAGDENNHANLKSHDSTPFSTEDEVQSETPSLSSSTAAMAAAAGLEQLLLCNEKTSTRARTAEETEEEARIRAELEFEIEKDLEREIRTKITLLSRRLDQLHNLQARRHPINNPKESDHYIHDQRQSGALNHDDADQAATLMKQLDLATSPIRTTAEINSAQSASKADADSHRVSTNHFRPSTPQPCRPVLTQSASCNKRMLHHPMNDHLSDKNHAHFSTYDRSHSLKKHSPTLATREACGTPAGLAMEDIRKLASDLISKTSKPGSLKLRTEKAMLKHLQTSLASITTRSKKFDWIRTLRGGNNSASPANPNAYSQINTQTSPTSNSSSQSQTSPFQDDQGCHVQSHVITNSHQSELASNLNSKKLKLHDHRKALLQQAAAITSGDNMHIHHRINHSDQSSHAVPSYSKPTISAAITTAITSQRFKINRHSSTSKAPPAATVAPNFVPHKFQDHDQVRLQSKTIKPEVPPAIIRGIKNPSASGKLNYRSLHTASSKAKEVVIRQQHTAPASKNKVSSHLLHQQQQSDQNMQVI